MAEGTFPVGIARVGDVVEAPRPKRSRTRPASLLRTRLPRSRRRARSVRWTTPLFIEFMDAPFLEEGLKSKSSNRLLSPLIAIVSRCARPEKACREATRSEATSRWLQRCARGERAQPTSKVAYPARGGSDAVSGARDALTAVKYVRAGSRKRLQHESVDILRVPSSTGRRSTA